MIFPHHIFSEKRGTTTIDSVSCCFSILRSVCGKSTILLNTGSPSCSASFQRFKRRSLKLMTSSLLSRVPNPGIAHLNSIFEFTDSCESAVSTFFKIEARLNRNARHTCCNTMVATDSHDSAECNSQSQEISASNMALRSRK